MFTFSKKDQVSTPLIDNQDDDESKDAADTDKMPKWLKLREEMEDEETAAKRRQIQLNYKKYSIAEDEMSKIKVRNRQTEFEKETDIDLELFGTKDSNIINEYIYKYGDGSWWSNEAVRSERAKLQHQEVREEDDLLNDPMKYANREDNLLGLRMPHYQKLVLEEAGIDEIRCRKHEIEDIKKQVPEQEFKNVEEKLEQARKERDNWKEDFDKKVKEAVEQQFKLMKDESPTKIGQSQVGLKKTTFKADGTVVMEAEDKEEGQIVQVSNMRKILENYFRLVAEFEKIKKQKEDLIQSQANKMSQEELKAAEDKIDAQLNVKQEELGKVADEYGRVYEQGEDPSFFKDLECEHEYRRPMVLYPKQVQNVQVIANECRMCGQEAILCQEEGYYGCWYEECLEEFRKKQHAVECKKTNKDGTPVEHNDEECTNQWKKYIVCRACALSKKEKNPLGMRVKLSVHEHQLERHSNMYTGHWGCACSSKQFITEINTKIEKELKSKNYSQSVYEEKLKKKSEKQLKCRYKDKVITDWKIAQGYGCLECEFHLCLICMERFRDQDFEDEKKQSETKEDPEQKQEHDQFEDPKPKEHEHSHNEEPNKKKEGEAEKEEDKFKSLIKGMTKDIESVPQIQFELEYIEGNKPIEAYNTKMSDYAVTLWNKDLLCKFILNVGSYHLTTDDETSMIDLEYMDKASYPEHAVLYQIKKKEIQFIKDPRDSEKFSVLIKTIEQTSKDLHKKENSNPHNLIKTIRIWQFDEKADKPRFKEKDAILLEQVPGHEYEGENAANYTISVINNNYKLYFWRRRKSQNNNNRWEMQLWSYDLRDGKAKPSENAKENLKQVTYQNFCYHEDVDKIRKVIYSENYDPFTYLCPTYDELMAQHEEEQFHKWCANYDAYWKKIDEENKKNKGKKKLTPEEEKEKHHKEIHEQPQFKMEEFMCGTGQPHLQFGSVLINPFPLDMEGKQSPEQLQIKKEEKDEKHLFLEKFRTEKLKDLDKLKQEEKVKTQKTNKPKPGENSEPHNELTELDVKYFENLDLLKIDLEAAKSNSELASLLQKTIDDQSAPKYKFLKDLWDDDYKELKEKKEEYKFLNSQYVLKQYYYPCKVLQDFQDKKEKEKKALKQKSPILIKVNEHIAAHEASLAKMSTKITKGLKAIGNIFGIGKTEEQEEQQREDEEKAKKEQEEKAAQESAELQKQLEEEQEEDDKDEKEGDEDDDVEVIKEQEFRIFKLDKFKLGSGHEIQKITNKKSKLPLLQFFVKITQMKEDKYDEREMRQRSVQGLEQEYLYFNYIHMVLFDSKAYEINFDTKRAEEFEDGIKPAPKMMIRNIPSTGVVRWINDPSEVQYFKIEKPGLSLLQYFVVSSRPNQLDPSKYEPFIKLISPVIHKNQQITKEIKDEIIKYLDAQNGYQKNGRQITTFSNYKGSASDNSTVVHCRRMNNNYLDNLVSYCRNLPYWEDSNFGHEKLSVRLEKARQQLSESGTRDITRICFMKTTYQEQMWIITVSNNSPIEVYVNQNSFQEVIDAKINPKDKEQRLKYGDSGIKDLLHRDVKEIWDSVQRNPKVIFRNSAYKRILYSFDKISFKLEDDEMKRMPNIDKSLKTKTDYFELKKHEEKKLKEKGHHGHVHHDDSEHDEDSSEEYDSEYDSDDDSEEEQAEEAPQSGEHDNKEWPENQLPKNFVELSEADKGNSIYIEDRRPDQRFPGRIKRVQIFDKETTTTKKDANGDNDDDDEEEITVTPITYYRSEENYCFLMKLNSAHWFFFTKSNHDIFDIGREIGNDKVKPLLSDTSKVYYLHGLRKTVPTTFAKLRKSLSKIEYLISNDDFPITKWMHIKQVHDNYTKILDKTQKNTDDDEALNALNRFHKFMLHVSVEKVVDQIEKTDFFPFVSTMTDCKVDSNPEFSPAKQVAFNIFSFTDPSLPSTKHDLTPQVICSIPINVTEGISKNCCGANIKLCKSTDMQTNEDIIEDENQISILKSLRRDYGSHQERVLRQRQSRYLIGFLFAGGTHRMVFKEIQVNSRIDMLRVGTNKIQREVFDQDFHIYQVGQRELIASAQEAKCYTITDFYIMPLTDEKDGCIVGTQLLLTNIDNKNKNKDKAFKNQQFQLITMLDNEQEKVNNLFQYESKVAMFGYQKFFNQNKGKNKEFENACYYLLGSVRIRQRTVMKANLDNTEILIVMKELIDNLFHWAPYTMRGALTEDFECQKARLFFHQQEVLMGQSMVILHMNDLEIIKERMNAVSTLLINQNTLLEECVRGDPARIEELKQEKIFKNQLGIVNNDFSFHTEIEKAFNLGEASAQKLLLESCLQLDTENYQPIFMQILGAILRSENLEGKENDANSNVEFILPFLSRRPGISSTQQFCNLERFMFQADLPLKSDQEQEWQEFSAFEDGNRVQSEIVEKIHQKLARKGIDVCDMKFAVEHSYIDWSRTILAFKLERFTQDLEPEDVYGKRFFSSLMVQEEIEFYVQDEVQKFIDFQFAETQQFFSINLLIYLFLFIIPFLIIVFKYMADYQWIQNGAMLCCLCSQNYFIAWEILQMKRDGLSDYLSSFRNWTELGQFLMFLVVFAREFLFRANDANGQQETPAWMKLMIMLIITQAFLKILFYLKIFSRYGFLVQMVFQSIVGVTGFLSFFMMWLIFFSLQYANLNVWFDDGDYPSVPFPIVVLLSTFRNSLGDLQIMIYKQKEGKDAIDDFGRHDWTAKAEEAWLAGDMSTYYLNNLMIILLWIFWFMNIALQNIILLNFLIAVISDFYATINEQQNHYMYKDKAEMNLECQDLKSLLFPQKELKSVSFSLDKTKFSAAKDPQEATKNAVRDSVEGVKVEIIAKLDDFYVKLQDQIEDISSGVKKSGATAAQAVGGGDEEEELGLDELALAESKASNEMLKTQNEVLGNQADELEYIKETIESLSQSVERLHSKQDSLRQQTERDAEKQQSIIDNLKNEVNQKFSESQQNTDAKFEEANKNQSNQLKNTNQTALDAIHNSQQVQIETISKSLIESISKASEKSQQLAESKQKQLDLLVAGFNQLRQDQELFKQQQAADQMMAMQKLMEEQLKEMKKVRDEAQANMRVMMDEIARFK